MTDMRNRLIIPAYTAPYARRIKMPAQPQRDRPDGMEWFAFKLGVFVGVLVGIVGAGVLLWIVR